MDNIRILSITSQNLSFGGRHDDTYTIDKEGIDNLRNLLREAHRELCKTANTAHDTIEKIECMLDHIDEFAPDREE